MSTIKDTFTKNINPKYPAVIYIKHHKFGYFDYGRSPEQFNWEVEFNDTFWSSEKRQNSNPYLTASHMVTYLTAFIEGFLAEHKTKISKFEVRFQGVWTDQERIMVEEYISRWIPKELKP
ncbi:MAG TPA: hypothetical protein VF941_06790 [Clostridia bacterium]